MAMSAPFPTALLESLLPPELHAAVRQPDPPAGSILAARRHLAGRLADLEPFVPPLISLARRAAADPGPLPAAYVGGTLLCADLSGFTALTAQLANSGRQGSEEVSAIINQIFARLLQAVDAAGGAVIKFAGDAITAFFDADRLGPAHASHAVDAALGMQQAMHAFKAMATSAGVFRLRLRVTVHSGMVFLGEVGDQRRRELIVTGRSVNQVIAAQRYAAAGEIVITPQTRALLPGADTRDRFPDLYLLLDLPERPPPRPERAAPPEPEPSLDGLLELAAAIQALGAYVPEGLLQRLGGATHTAGEFRPVSVVFTHIAALGSAMAMLDDSAEAREVASVHEVLNTCYGRLQAVLGHFGGSINKLDMAVGGDRLMGTFGAPIAHEDDPQRAVKAALELRAALTEIDRDTLALLHSWREIHGLAPARPARQA
ncbi:MAG TPA: adenylate/guanylate cyclase domain-containing protein, partial [Herpetosiphonaceae bacterium]|nr:adenylate/guanylate cyclase domain-containing protein [Herpetosiphonaceae bacterium]